MTTAEIIESMTDEGKFEILAIRILRNIYDECRYLVHTGVNSIGKTIPNPVDAFCLVPDSDPPRFVMVACTTTQRKLLKSKWLFDHESADRKSNHTPEKDGDLIKAIRQSKLLRKNHPNAIFVIYLCSNKEPNIDLIEKIYQIGQQKGVEVRLVTRSILRDHLDTTPDGQWLRKEYLGIQAERLSLSLLKELCDRNLQQYGKEFSINTPDTFVVTSSASDLNASINSNKSIQLVTGTSGRGKSVLCYQVLRDHLNTDGIGLWIPGDIVDLSISLEEAINHILSLLYPTIEARAGTDLFGSQTISRRVLLVVDDINRSNNPSKSLRKIIEWGRPIKYDQENQQIQSYTLVVPVLDKFMEPHFQEEDWLAIVPVSLMNETEAIACLSASLGKISQHLSYAHQQQIVSSLGFDPILIAMYADIVNKHSDINFFDITQDVLNRFVKDAINEVSISGKYHSTEYDSALVHLAEYLLSNKDLYPLWDQLNKWLSLEEVNAIRELAKHNKICRIISRGCENQFEFRHDRILEYYLIRALKPMFSNIECYHNILSDPFYASFVGRALLSIQPSDELLKWVKQNTPLALFSTIRFSSLSNPVIKTIAFEAKDWLHSIFQNPRMLSPLLLAVFQILEITDSPYILEITKSLVPHRFVLLARLANGDATAGVINFAEKSLFYPAVNDGSLDAVLSRALCRHRQILIDECVKILQRPDLQENERHGAFVLAGFIGDVSLVLSIETAWKSAINKSNILLPALWANFRCSVDGPLTSLDEVMNVWADLPDKTERDDIARSLKFAMRKRKIPETILLYLITMARKIEVLHFLIIETLGGIDHPLVMRFLVEEFANIERSVNYNGFSLWLTIIRQQWDTSINSMGKRLSKESIEVLRNCWESEIEDSQLRETAFKFWIYVIDDLDSLRQVSPKHPQFMSVLNRRAMLGDLSVVPLIKPLLFNYEYLFYVLRKVWSKEFLDPLEQALLELKDKTPTDYSGKLTDMHYWLAELLRDIPVAEALPILFKHWEYLRYSSLFVQLALYLGTPECITLAEEAIQAFPNKSDLFSYIGHIFGFCETSQMDRLNQRHLEVLLPYLSQLDDIVLSNMAEFCERRKYFKWGNENLKPEFDRRRKLLQKEARDNQVYIERLGRHHYPSDIDLLVDLDRIVKQGGSFYGPMYVWSEGFVRRNDEHERWRYLLKNWLNQTPTLERFRVIVVALIKHGTRKDLDIIYNIQLSGDNNEIDCLKASAIFGVMKRSLR